MRPAIMDQRPRHDDPLAALSKRERIIAGKFGEGLTYRQIGEALYIAPSTVRSHIAAIYRKLNIRNKAALIGLVLGRRNAATSEPASVGPQEATVTSGLDSRRALPCFAASGGTSPPILAVVPFENLSGVADLEYVARGVSEDLRTELSRFYSLHVVASSYAGVCKGQLVDCL
jgi:DNA-binding CsgD family transcriptional regulator